MLLISLLCVLLQIAIFSSKRPKKSKMFLEDVLQFITGKRIIAPGDESVIHLVFIKATKDGFYCPVVST